jgi:predicted metal-binding membrane protein
MLKQNSQKIFLALIVMMIALAWSVLWWWGQSPYNRFLDHQGLGELNPANVSFLVVFVAGWTLMSIAMMLPTSLPLINLFYTVIRNKKNRLSLIYLLLVGYITVWAAFGVVAHLGDWLVHGLVDRNQWLHNHSWLIGATILLAAGVYQFTPLKYYCLDKCRTPRTSIMQYWRGKNESIKSIRLGLRHGLFCLGCCWSLMLLMFGVGTGNFGWMLILGLIMGVEKNFSWGKKLSYPLGLCLISWGTGVFFVNFASLF